MKNIVLCSDGTGNSAGKILGTNVWRLFEAVDRTAKVEQVAFHDDGVGTENSKLLRVFGSALGWGLTHNLEQLYAFLVQNYNAGDQLYLFGFSRGAFTIRVLANMIYYCGIADRRERTPAQIDELAAQAVAAYKKRKIGNPDAQATYAFREKEGVLNAKHNVDGRKGWFPIRFVGVWDTVEAVGLPFDELTDAFSWLIPTRLKKDWAGRRENDLHPLIQNAYHALSIDDERHTFHPVVFIEDPPYDPCDPPPTPEQRAAELAKPEVRKQLFLDIDPTKNPQLSELKQKQKVEQVWFAGMHANVGGGYPVDSLAGVPLLWMMEKAKNCDLVFDETKRKEYQLDADVHGKMYDSRSGAAVYFRYRPRDLQAICAEGGLVQPKLHASVLQRISRHTQQYAPTGVPTKYDIDEETLLKDEEKEKNPQARQDRHRHVDNLIWQGRALYFAFLLWTIAIVLTGLGMRDSPTPDIAEWHWIKRGIWSFLRPFMDLLIFFVPSYFASGVIALRNSPYVLGGFAGSYVLIYGYNWFVSTKIAEHCNLGWKYSFEPGMAPASYWGFPALETVRTQRFLVKAANFIYAWVVPVVSLVLAAIAIVVILFWTLYPMSYVSREPEMATTIRLEPQKFPVDFNAKRPLQVTPIVLEAGVKYRITAVTTSPWLDWTLDAGPDGLTDETKMPPLMRLANGTKRVKDQPWFKLMGSIGPDEDELLPIGSKYEFWAKKTGRLYLFVNDAPGLYWNNQGSAAVVVERLVN